MNSTNYKQYDTRWAKLPYPTKKWNIGNSGCGEVAICNSIIEMAKYSGQTPKTIQPYCKQYAAPNGDGTYWSGIPAMMKHYGMTEVKEHANMSSLWKELAKGDRVAIYLMGSRKGGSKKVHWTSGGHFVCSVAYKYENGKHYVYVKDSNSTSALRNGFISYEENMRNDVSKVWSGKLSGTPAPTPTPTPTPTPKKGTYTGSYPNPKKYLEKGDEGSGVTLWQKYLNWSFGGQAGYTKLDEDGIFGKDTDKWTKLWQEEAMGKGQGDGKVGSKTIAKAKELGGYVAPTKTQTPTQTPQEKACAWGKKIADDNTWHYVKWNSKDEKTHECPICKNHPKGKYHGWNYIGFAWACWRHGAGIKCKCNNHVIDNACAEKILKASAANALKIVKEKSGLNDVKVIRNNGDVIPQSKLKAGDICLNYKGKTYQHTFLYLGDGKMVDAQGSSGKISNNDQIKVRNAVSAKVAIRYTGK